MKRKLLNGFNLILTSLLALLGFGCNMAAKYGSPEVEVMYGVPHADLMLSGTVTDTEGEPLQDIQISVRINDDRYAYPYICTYTDESGNYHSATENFSFPTNYVTVIARDTTLQYEADSVKLAVDYDTTNAGTWYKGTGIVNADFRLKEKEANQETGMAQ